MNKEFHGGNVMMRIINKRASILGLVLALLLSLAGPPNVSAITLGSCVLNIGTTCNLDPVLFTVVSVTPPNAAIPIGTPFAEVVVAVESYTANAFEYRYQIINPQFAITNFQLDLSAAFTKLGTGAVTNPLTGFGVTGDFTYGLTGDNIVAPNNAGMLGDQFLATFFEPPISPQQGGIKKSDIMFIQSPLSPIDLASLLVGNSEDPVAALTAFALLKGPGSTITATAVQPAPEPSTLLLLGSGLFGLGAALRLRRRACPSC